MYIHIPFCDQRCGYCSFFTRAGQNQATQIRVLEHIKRQWKTQTIVADKRETIYMGGGTPSSLDLPVLRDFLTFVRENIYNHTTQEWTIEMHPEHVTPEKLELIQSLGCTRVSIGVQSFDPQTRAAL
jgi:oxygen-independent coproporphyrinogen-3 oxidase